MTDLQFRQFCDNDSIEELAQLIMDTDPYIYADLFGSKNVACKVLPYLFRLDKGIFRKNSYYICLRNGKIVAMAALFKAGDTWDQSSVKTAFIEAGEPLPESFDAVSEYFKSAHNYTPGTKACNVCVTQNLRGQGLGDFMVKQLIRLAGNSDICLSVMQDNIAAVKLYQSNGFKIIYEFDDYGGYGNAPIKCYFMIRFYSLT